MVDGNAERHTFWILPEYMRVAEVIFFGGPPDPVPPANLTLDDSDGLVARVVPEILECYSASYDGELN